MNDHLARIIEQICALNEKYYELIGWTDAQNLGPPAQESDIRTVEVAANVRLPADYREFLLMHDGWRGFNGELDLLSTTQMRDPKVCEWFAELRHIARGDGQTAAADGFIIMGATMMSEIVFIDFREAETEAAPEFVRWEHQEIERLPNFVSYLKKYVKILEDVIKLEKQRFR